LQQQSLFSNIQIFNLTFLFFSRRIVYLIETNPLSEVYQVEWEYHYKDIKQIPIVKFNPNSIQFYLKVNQIKQRFFKNKLTF